MVTFDLKGSALGDEPGCTIHPGRYPKQSADEPDQVGWQALSARGEPLGQPTVNLWDPPVFPAPGCVFVKVTREYRGWLESLIAAGLVEPTGREEGSGYVDRYAVECRVLNPQLLEVA